jgi:hypothetical protein
MKNRGFRKLVTMFLIASPLWWTTGCHSSYQVTGPAEVSGTPIQITTKGNNHYTFAEWFADSSGNIRGYAPFVMPVAVQSDYGKFKQQLPLQLIPKDSIAAIHVQRVNVGATVLTVILTTAGVIAGAYLLFTISALVSLKNKVDGSK